MSRASHYIDYDLEWLHGLSDQADEAAKTFDESQHKATTPQ